MFFPCSHLCFTCCCNHCYPRCLGHNVFLLWLEVNNGSHHFRVGVIASDEHQHVGRRDDIARRISRPVPRCKFLPRCLSCSGAVGSKLCEIFLCSGKLLVISQLEDVI